MSQSHSFISSKIALWGRVVNHTVNENERRAEHPQLDWPDPFSFNYFFNTFCKQSNSEIYYKDKGHKHLDDIGVSIIFGILMYICKFVNYIFGTLNPFIVIYSSHSSWVELGISLGGVLIVK